MRWLAINDRRYSFLWLEENFHQGQEVLRAAHDAGLKPLCLCQPHGIPMYVAKQNKYYLAKMPETGHLHAPDCPSYETPPDLSGRRCYVDGVIEQSEIRTIILPRFSLLRDSGSDDGDEHEDGRKMHRLGLKGLLHLLWENARFHTWHPRMEGKRNWAVIRHHIYQTANHTFAWSLPLAPVLFIPEQFSKERRQQQLDSQGQYLNAILTNSHSSSAFLLLGQVKSITPSRYDSRLLITHMPETPLWISKELEGLMHRSAFEVDAIKGENSCRTLALAIVEVTKRRTLALVDIALMATTPEWIPVFSRYDMKVATELIKQQRHFFKPMRYEAELDDPIPDFILLDTGEKPTHMEVVTAFRSKRAQQARMDSIAERQSKGAPVWLWDVARTGTGNMPAIPRLMTRERI